MPLPAMTSRSALILKRVSETERRNNPQLCVGNNSPHHAVRGFPHLNEGVGKRELSAKLTEGVFLSYYLTYNGLNIV